MRTWLIVVLVGLSAGCVPNCARYDGNFIPYRLKGLDVYVYNDRTNREYYAGHVEASYFSRDSALSQCSASAYSLARERDLEDWSYIWCTVTASSDCVTKVR